MEVQLGEERESEEEPEESEEMRDSEGSEEGSEGSMEETDDVEEDQGSVTLSNHQMQLGFKIECYVASEVFEDPSA